MKITLAFCALATIVVAVPTYPQGYQGQEALLDYVANGEKRDKKSTLQDPVPGTPPDAMAGDPPAHGSLMPKPTINSMERKSFGFNKPIIIKKKIGYHVYRDSDEEMAHADPNENCRKQVKVKLCDDGSGSTKNMLNCFTSERFNEGMSEKEIENSIKTAKEAVEHLQRGLMRMEHTSKIIHDKDLESDFEVHENIEAARKALEHVQQNFGKIETINEQENSPKKTDEERLSHWKEEMDNVQKKTEIGRNIEDAFKSESAHISLSSGKKSGLERLRENDDSNANLSLKQTFNTVDTENENSNQKEKSVTMDLNQVKNTFESTLLEDNKETPKKLREDVDFDMFTSPFENKVQLHSDSLKSDLKSTQEETVRSSILKSSNNNEKEILDTQKPLEHAVTMKNSQDTQFSGNLAHTHENESEAKICNNIHEHDEKAASDISLRLEEKIKQDNFANEKHTTLNLHQKAEKNAPADLGMRSMMKDISGLKTTSEEQALHANSDILTARHGDLEDKIFLRKEEKESATLKKSSNTHIDQASDEAQKLRSNLDEVKKQPNEPQLKSKNSEKSSNENENHNLLQLTTGHHNKNANENLLKNAFNGNRDNRLDSAFQSSATTNHHQELHEGFNSRFAEESNLKPISNTNEEFINLPQDFDEQSLMRMFENENMAQQGLHSNMKMAHEHSPQLMGTDNLNNPWIMRMSHESSPPRTNVAMNNGPRILNEQTGMRISHLDENASLHALQNPLLMRLAHEKHIQDEHMVQPLFTELRKSHISPSKESNLNDQHFMNGHTNMRLNEDPNTGHQLSDFHELSDPSLMNWAHLKQRNDHMSQFAKTASEHSDEHMLSNDGHHHEHTFDDINETTLKERENMWPQASVNHEFIMRLAHEKQLRDQFNMNPELHSDHLHEHLHDVSSQNRFSNSFDSGNVHDFPQQMMQSHDHLNMMKHAHLSDMDSAMQQSMMMNMRDSHAQPVLEHNDMNWNHHHHSMARYGSSIPVAGVSPGAVGVFPNANTGCGIPLMLSCSPSVVSGSLAKAHPATISAPAYRSGDDLMFYIKRDAQNNKEMSTIKVQKSPTLYNHKSN